MNSRFNERSRWNSDQPRAPQHAAQLQLSDQAIDIHRPPADDGDGIEVSQDHRCPLFRQRHEAWRSDRSRSWLASIVYVRTPMTRCITDSCFQKTDVALEARPVDHASGGSQ